MGVWTNIKSDLFRYYGKVNLSSFVKTFLLVEGFRYMFFHRVLTGCSKKNPLYWVLFLIKRHYSYKYGFQIFSINIGQGFYIGHFGTIVINGATIIGDNVNVSPGVVIGQVSRGSKKGVPVIGDRVWIGSNAVIVGNIKIGNDVLVAPGAYVTFDVPPNSLVMGNPGSIVKDNINVDGYIVNTFDE